MFRYFCVILLVISSETVLLVYDLCSKLHICTLIVHCCYVLFLGLWCNSYAFHYRMAANCIGPW